MFPVESKKTERKWNLEQKPEEQKPEEQKNKIVTSNVGVGTSFYYHEDEEDED